MISIHAPLTGSDLEQIRRQKYDLLFQSTLPLRGATGIITVPQSPVHNFNPRSPYGERPLEKLGIFPDEIISIHAPLTGSDQTVTVKIYINPYFNPRSPYGERPLWRARDINFQIRFQSTLPLRGATEKNMMQKWWPLFQSTLPLRGATGAGPRYSIGSFISIHAPLTGSD